MYDKRVVVVGAGVIGLATARALGKRGFSDILILEAASLFGSVTSSRNSCVLHAGIYYKNQSNKHLMCIEGHKQILQFCKDYNIPHDICGKLIVNDRFDDRLNNRIIDDGDNELEAIYHAGVKNGAKLEMIRDARRLSLMEPNLNPEIRSAIFSPLTGIIDVHQYMLALLSEAEGNGASICYECEFLPLASSPSPWETISSARTITLETNQGPIDDVAFVVNVAGLRACQVARMIDREANIPSSIYAKGTYWRLDNAKVDDTKVNQAGIFGEAERPPESKKLFEHLIYPLPELGGLGTHLTLDLDGSCRFGPNVEWLGGNPKNRGNSKIVQYDPLQENDGSSKNGGYSNSGFDLKITDDMYIPSAADEKVYDSIRRYFPALKDGALIPDYSGIRPKLVGCSDFMFVYGFRCIHALGIESPGLTASLAIAEEIANGVVRKI